MKQFEERGVGPAKADYIHLITQFDVRFSKPVVVPDDGVGALLEVTGKVAKELDERRVQMDLTVSCAGQKVLGKATAVVRRG